MYNTTNLSLFLVDKHFKIANLLQNVKPTSQSVKTQLSLFINLFQFWVAKPCCD